MTFDEMFSDLINRINSYKISQQQAFGLVSTVKEQIAAHLAENLKNQAVVENWQKTVEEYAPKTGDLPLVEAVEDN